ncbi:transcriptional regulator HrpR [Pseudomonas syringae pv. syringae]|uniref:transcriptional regulator HrpR n=1 Tax=Pseudomonas syringae TaxID=317 RepID=UPI000CDAC266|nr:transcriptional regulator HrpR [Pseudomonas syringae]MCH5528436.1 transcriptional regulator HrpR [Pseudomonas syringae pv. syringae]MCH5541831.1 transcriptional regulator HrpR [Pseudomonas syringae pv. syringae]MCH5546935.1 transcriptional regulator HrpR [Pseudomonas syringae pv. syringae]MCH5601838.1 transcriptional regulator HrpR [Pseudomonas syringae pv. syringae]MCH5610281.1 transcriptional regulator HrpR [Pseudomonas syringae pv. syringae]
MSTDIDNDVLTCCNVTALSAGHQIVMNSVLMDMDLLLCGETGTGKDTLASRIHELSSRTGPFVGMNCAAIPESLAESQLFGVVNGAFTGVCRAREGYIEASSGGTLYLDEIDSMPLSLQAKLLRVLESRGVERLGSTDFIPLDLRVIASAQRPLDELVEQGLFRRDLFFRLNVLTLQLPALRKRREQILPLFDQFTQDIAAESGRSVPTLDNRRVQILLSHDWPGNVRELKSAAKRFVLGLPLLGAEPVEARDPVTGLRMQMRVIEKMLIQDALKRHRHNFDAVLEELELPRRTLYHRMKELGVASHIDLVAES